MEMLLVYGFCKGNGRESVRFRRFLNRQVPNHQTVANIERRRRENGSFEGRHVDGERHHTTTTAEIEEHILNVVEQNTKISTYQTIGKRGSII